MISPRGVSFKIYNKQLSNQFSIKYPFTFLSLSTNSHQAVIFPPPLPP